MEHRDKEEPGFHYLAQNGKWYTGAFLSYDTAEYFFGEAFRNIIKKLERELLNEKK